jgi:hypothetical protein
MYAPDQGSSQASSKQRQGRDLVTALLDAFAPFISDNDSIRRALVAAFDVGALDEELEPDKRLRPVNMAGSPPLFPTSFTSEAIVIDKAALAKGIWKAGQETDAELSSARWLVEWLEARSLVTDQLKPPNNSAAERNRQAFESGVPIIASRSLRSRVLPRAMDLAKTTVGRERADMRHLIFALLEEDPATMHPLDELLDAKKVLQLKSWLMKQITANCEPNENIKAWRELAKRPPAFEGVGTLSDAPALVDSLGRHAFADVLAARIKQVSGSLRSGKLGDDSAFILHVDGPWGSGKSSILNFVKKNLENSDPPWLIIEFNAWRNQQRKPAWWPIIAHVGGAVRRRGWLRYPRARWVWARWNLRMRWVPIALSTILVLVFLYFASGAITGSAADPQNVASASNSPDMLPERLGKAFDTAVKGVLALFALGGLALTTSRSIFMGSKSAAEAYIQSSAEPFRPIVKLFDRLILAIGRPVAIFIDDIDRCDSAYVIELLEGIQTLLRSAPVVYVVAGDRKWICSSFEKRYTDFCGELGQPGRPLGYLFLDKVFQLSTAIPRLSALRQAEYWTKLLESGRTGGHPDEAELQRQELEAEAKLKGKTRHEDMQREIDNSTNAMQRETLRAAAAKQITSPEAIKAAEHRLQNLAPLLEANPRSMKRLVNAYGLNHARAFLEGRKVAVEALARWTIIELRWPILANFLAENWTDVSDGGLSPAQFPEQIRTLLSDSDVREVFGRKGQTGRLTNVALGQILG